MSKEKNKESRRTGILEYLIDLFRRYEQNKLSDTMKQALDEWTPDVSKAHGYPMDETKAELVRKRIEQKVTRHIQRDFRWKPRIIYRKYAAVAAVLLLIGIVGWLTHTYKSNAGFFMAETRQMWTTPDTLRTSLTLPDGTLVQVNAGSRLEIARADFNKDKREVWLEGEAFFEVTKDPERPFIIHSGDIQTIVRGTSFNVRAYAELDENIISVRDGCVEITNNDKLLGILTADKQLSYRKTNKKVEITESNWANAAGWIDGRLVLNGEGIKELKLRLRQQFGVEVLVEEHTLEGKQLQGAFRAGSSLTEVMDAIAAMYNIRYRIKEKQVIIN